MPRGLQTNLWYLTTGLVACCLYAALPYSFLGESIYLGIVLSVPIAGALGYRRRHPEPPDGWSLLLVGMAILGLCESAMFIGDWMFGQDDSGLIINIFCFVGYAVQLLGLVRIIHRRVPRLDVARWLDALAVSAAVLCVSWVLLYRSFRDMHLAASEWMVTLGLVVCGLSLVIMAARLMLSEPLARVGLGLLVLGYALQSTADISWHFVKGYSYGSRLDVVWAAAYVFIGAGIVRPGVPPAKAATPEDVRRETRHVITLQGFLVAAVCVACAAAAIGDVPVPVVGVFLVAAFALLAAHRARVNGLMHELGETSEIAHQRRLSAIVDASHDAIVLVEPDGTVRYVSPSLTEMFDTDYDATVGQHFRNSQARRYPVLDQLRLAVESLPSGQHLEWEGVIRDPGAPAVTLQVTAANHCETEGVNGYVFTIRNVSERAQMLEDLRYQSTHDSLTGLANRRLLAERTSEAVLGATAAGALPALLLLDVDDFKIVNDSLGLEVGDQLLRAVAQRLLECVPRGATVARLGGDEFAVLLALENADMAGRHAQFVLDHLAATPILAAGCSFSVRASAGVSVYHCGDASAELLRSADIALHEAKRDGKGRAKVFRDEMHRSADAELRFRSDLADALGRKEFTMQFQPVVSVATGRVHGVEALLRWNSSSRGDVPRQDFVQVAEQHGFISEIGEWALRTACQQAMTWPDIGDAYLSVNISAAQITDPRLIGVVRSALADSGFPANRLVLELTETMFVGDNELSKEITSALQREGVRVALDDFGTGHCSLAQLSNLNIDLVKIDRSFVSGVDTSPHRRALAKTLIHLAADLGIQSVAEGVEHRAEIDVITGFGCDLVQGYWFSKPLSPTAIRQFLSASSDTPAPAPVAGQ